MHLSIFIQGKVIWEMYIRFFWKWKALVCYQYSTSHWSSRGWHSLGRLFRQLPWSRLIYFWNKLIHKLIDPWTEYNYLFISLTCLLIFDVDSECTSEQLLNKRGVCVTKIQELLRISRPFPQSFRSGDNDTTPIVKCSDLTSKFKLEYLQARICFFVRLSQC